MPLFEHNLLPGQTALNAANTANTALKQPNSPSQRTFMIPEKLTICERLRTKEVLFLRPRKFCSVILAFPQENCDS